jgi:hypothetical protein
MYESKDSNNKTTKQKKKEVHWNLSNLIFVLKQVNCVDPVASVIIGLVMVFLILIPFDQTGSKHICPKQGLTPVL